MFSFRRLSEVLTALPQSLVATVTWKRTLRQRAFAVEGLEPRRLLSNTVVEYPAPSVGGTTADPSSIIGGANGTLWFVEPNTDSVGSISDTNLTAATYPASLSAFSRPESITESPDGKIWFTETLGNEIGMIDPSSSTAAVTLYGTVQGMTAASRPFGITYADGDLWFTQENSQQIGKLDPTTGLITEYSVPSAITGLQSQITLGPDGNLWFTEVGYLGVFSPTSDAMVTQVPLPEGANELPFGITSGPGGTIWYTDGVLNQSSFDSYSVGVVNATNKVVSNEIPVVSSSEPYGITQGPDGNMWIAITSGSIDAINPTNDSIVQSLAVPDAGAAPTGVTVGSDGNIWFADGSGAVGEVELGTQLSLSTPPPTSVSPGTAVNFVVTDEYATGATDAAFNGTVQVSLGGSVIASATAVDGVATFNGITLNQLGTDVLAIASTATSDIPAATSATVVVGYSPPPTPPAPQLSSADVSGTRDDLTDVSRPTLIGTAQPGATITVYDSGVATPFGTATATATGDYTITLGTPNALSPGAYELTVIATNSQGSSQPSSPFALTVVAPPVTPSAPSLLASESNGAPGGETTTSTSPELVGTTEDSVTVQLLNASGTVLATTQSTSSGSYEIQAPGPLSLGAYAYRVSIIDQYGDVSSPSPAQTINVVALPTPSPTTSPTPTPTPPPTPVIIGEVPIFSRKLNKKGQPTGKATLTGFELIFSQPMNATAQNPSEYTVEKVVAKATRKKPEKLSNVGFGVSYESASTILIGVKNQTFPTGGLLTVNGAVSSVAGAALGSTDTFLIGKGGKTITPE